MQATPPYEWGKNFTSKLDLSSYGTVLDLGCRDGQLSAHLAKKYPALQLLGIDNVSENIEAAKQLSLPNLSFETQNALSLPYLSCFDAVVSFNCLLWIKNKQCALEKAFAALKPGGKLFLQFFAPHGRPQNDRFIYQTARNPDWDTYSKNFQVSYHEMSVDEFCRLVNRIGFVIHHLEFAHYPTTFEHPENLQNWLKSWVPHKHIPIRKQDHYF